LERDMLVPRRINLLEIGGGFHWTAFFRKMGFKLMKLQ